MRLREVCDTCGREVTAIEMDGPEFVIDRWLQKVGTDRGLCLKRGCTGRVHFVKETVRDAGASRAPSLLDRLWRRDK
jgi:hypothetical protein